MPLLAPLQTDFLGLVYPDRRCNPFYDQYVEFVVQVEAQLFMSKVFTNMWMAGGGVRTWNAAQSQFTWTKDFVLPVPNWGFKITVPYGPDGVTRTMGLSDGGLIVVSVPMGLPGNLTMNFQVLSQLDAKKIDQFVCGMRVGNALYLKGIGELT